jgi:hypothetical protein
MDVRHNEREVNIKGSELSRSNQKLVYLKHI